MLKFKVKVLPTLSGFFFDIQEGTPPFEVYLYGKDLVVRTSNAVFEWQVDRRFNFSDVYFTVRDSTGASADVVLGSPQLNFAERGFILEILKREALVLKVRGGFEVRLYKKRRVNIDGPCKECSLERKYAYGDDSTCPLCFGTGVTGGYYPPLHTYGNYYDRTDVRVDGLGPIRITEHGFWMVGTPISEKDDLLYVPTLGRMFRVLDVKYFEYKGIPIKQLVHATEVPPGHPVYVLAHTLSLYVEDKTNLPGDEIGT